MQRYYIAACVPPWLIAHRGILSSDHAGIFSLLNKPADSEELRWMAVVRANLLRSSVSSWCLAHRHIQFWTSAGCWMMPWSTWIFILNDFFALICSSWQWTNVRYKTEETWTRYWKVGRNVRLISQTEPGPSLSDLAREKTVRAVQRRRERTYQMICIMVGNKWTFLKK